MDNLTAKVEKVHLDEDAKRQEAARKLSKAIDPFRRTVDCSGCKSEQSFAFVVHAAKTRSRRPSGAFIEPEITLMSGAKPDLLHILLHSPG